MLFRHAASPSTDFATWFNQNYLHFLKEVRCQHSKQKTPCPSILAAWTEVYASGTLDQAQLTMALELTNDTAKANKSLIDTDCKSQVAIRNFLKGLQTAPCVSMDNKALARKIQLDLDLSKQLCRIS